MTENVVVLGAGYAGTGTVNKLQSELEGNARLTWIADVDYHLVLHESHRVIRDPDVRSDITFPVNRIADPSTRFIQDEVTGLDVDEQTVELADGDDVDYDYVLVGLGSQTAYYGIPGLEEHSLTLKSLDDALEINEAVTEASQEATRGDPAQVVIGGAGLSASRPPAKSRSSATITARRSRSTSSKRSRRSSPATIRKSSRRCATCSSRPASRSTRMTRSPRPPRTTSSSTRANHSITTCSSGPAGSRVATRWTTSTSRTNTTE